MFIHLTYPWHLPHREIHHKLQNLNLIIREVGLAIWFIKFTANLSQHFIACDACTSSYPHLFIDPLSNIWCNEYPAHVIIKAIFHKIIGEVDVCLVETCTITFDIIVLQNLLKMVWDTSVFRNVRFNEDQVWTQSPTYETRHCTFNTVFSSDVVCGGDHSIISDSYWLVFKTWVVSNFNSRIKHIHVNMHPCPSYLTLLDKAVHHLFNLFSCFLP